MKNISIYILPSAIGFFVLYVISTYFYTQFANGDFSIYWRFLQIGLGAVLIFYFFILIVSVPVIFLVKKVFGLKLWSSLFAGVIILVITSLFIIFSENKFERSHLEYFTIKNFLITVMFGVTSFGFSLWMLGKEKEK